ncbi:uncharacterized protein LOC132334783 isoform X1 [Haemorhous mexicanus]|uniref:uncharacterized protein LOC132334783 isoform X1 n=1 Tax=Haemorhous mexicanus TaxID=30427 RepID=UPI0028BF3E2E|nr:uncharacterized protein LOC132334783 isoform X1 [Haemorhous mexicanus]
MKVAVLSVALLFSILLCPPAQAKGLRMPLDRCPPPKMPGPPRGPLPNQGSWSESGAGPVPQVLLTCCSLRQRCPERQEDEGGCAQRGPALLHPAVPPGPSQAQTDLLGGREFPSLCRCPAPWSCVPPQPHKVQSRPSLCSPFQALLEGTQDDLRELDLDNVVVLETPAGVRPSPFMATTAQAIPVCPSTAQCTPPDSPDNAFPQGSSPGKPFPRAPAAFPSRSPQEPLDEPGCSPCPSCASWPGAQCFWAGAQQSCTPLLPQSLPLAPPLLCPASQSSPVPPVCL